MAAIRELEQSILGLSDSPEPNWEEINAQKGFVMSQQEKELVQRAVGGDVDSFGGLYGIYLKRVYNYVSRRVDPDAAEDLAAQTFLNAFRNISNYKPSAPFGAWIFRIAHNLVANHYRGMSKNPQIYIEDATALRGSRSDLLDSTQISDDTSRVREALESLIPRHRTVLVRRYYEEKSFEEIGEELGIKANAARVLMDRARDSLRVALKQEDARVASL